MKTIVLSGATGFIGRNLVPRLRLKGHRVWVIQRESSKNAAPASDGCIYYDGSISSLQRGLQLAHPEIAVHLASLFISEHQPEQVGELVESNLDFSTKYLESCVNCGVGSFINTGSAWQRFQGLEYRAVNLYAATKEAFEVILDYYVDLGSLAALTIRLGDTYGPNDTRRKIVSLLVESALSGTELNMSGGEQIINLVQIEDVCTGFMQAIELCENARPALLGKFALRGAESLTIRELALRVEDATNRKMSINWGARPYRKREVFIPESMTPNLPGWMPRVSLSDGLSELVRFYFSEISKRNTINTHGHKC